MFDCLISFLDCAHTRGNTGETVKGKWKIKVSAVVWAGCVGAENCSETKRVQKQVSCFWWCLGRVLFSLLLGFFGSYSLINPHVLPANVAGVFELFLLLITLQARDWRSESGSVKVNTF